MAIAPNNIETFEGWIDDIMIEMEHLDDQFDKSIARNEYPYVDGADLQDLGQKAHTIKVRCYFWDDGDIHTTYNDHIRLINHLKKQSLVEFIHPKYGLMKGCIESVSVRHDDRLRHAEVDLGFVEQMRGNIQASQAEDVESTTEDQFLSGEDEQEQELADDLDDAGLDAEEDLDEDMSVFDQVKAASATIREIAKEIDGYVNYANALVNEVMQPINSLVATINYAASLPGRIIGVITKAVERVARLYDSIRSFPARFLGSLNTAFNGLINAVKAFSPRNTRGAVKTRQIMVKHVTIACARRLALEAAYVYNIDEQNRQLVRRAEKGRSFDVNGNYTAAAQTDPVMNVQELETSLAATRAMLQSGVELARGMQSLKDMARSLLEHVNTIKLERDRIITVTLDNSMPLHLVCLRYGLPYNYAERITSINMTLANPNFTGGSVRIYTLPGGGQ